MNNRNLNITPPHLGDEDEKALIHSLRKYAYIFPTKVADIEALLSSDTIKNIVVPELPGADKILENGLIMQLPEFTFAEDYEQEENLAQAAREGGEIPEDVADQMMRDRKAAEEKRNEGDKSETEK